MASLTRDVQILTFTSVSSGDSGALIQKYFIITLNLWDTGRWSQHPAEKVLIFITFKTIFYDLSQQRSGRRFMTMLARHLVALEPITPTVCSPRPIELDGTIL